MVYEEIEDYRTWIEPVPFEPFEPVWGSFPVAKAGLTTMSDSPFIIPIILMKSFFFVSKKSLIPSKNGFHNSIALGLFSSGNIKPVGLVGYGVGPGL